MELDDLCEQNAAQYTRIFAHIKIDSCNEAGMNQKLSISTKLHDDNYDQTTIIIGHGRRFLVKQQNLEKIFI